MKIDYAVIASDDNPLYLDFYPIVAKRWNDMNIKTIMLHVTNEDSEVENEYGIYRKVKAIEGINSGLQSQVIRLYSSVLYPECNLLMSDIDMLPINKDYFIDGAEPINEDEILSYTGQPYGGVPYYPMCYILGKGSILSEALDIQSMNFEEYVKFLSDNYSGAWNTDENFMYEKFNTWSKFEDKVIVRNDRDLKRRVDRGNWNWQIDKLQSGYYIDSHMIRPYSQHKQAIDFLVSQIKD